MLLFYMVLFLLTCLYLLLLFIDCPELIFMKKGGICISEINPVPVIGTVLLFKANITYSVEYLPKKVVVGVSQQMGLVLRN